MDKPDCLEGETHQWQMQTLRTGICSKCQQKYTFPSSATKYHSSTWHLLPSDIKHKNLTIQDKRKHRIKQIKKRCHVNGFRVGNKEWTRIASYSLHQLEHIWTYIKWHNANETNWKHALIELKKKEQRKWRK